jgi:cell division protein FtsN
MIRRYLLLYLAGLVSGVALHILYLAPGDLEPDAAPVAETASPTPEKPGVKWTFYDELVKPTAIEPMRPSSPGITSPSISSGHYSLQAGAFSDTEKAELQIQELKGILGAQFSMATSRSDDGRAIRVMVGPFSQYENAVAARDLLTSRGVAALLLTRAKN